MRKGVRNSPKWWILAPLFFMSAGIQKRPFTDAQPRAEGSVLTGDGSSPTSKNALGMTRALLAGL